MSIITETVPTGTFMGKDVESEKVIERKVGDTVILSLNRWGDLRVHNLNGGVVEGETFLEVEIKAVKKAKVIFE